jgi:hypothetical protein
MIGRRIPIWVVIAASFGSGFAGPPAAAQTPATAAALLDAAEAQSSPGQRSILAIFHAPWCGWCHQLDSFIESAPIKPIVDKYFVVVHFHVQEQAGAKETNTPAADALLAQLGGSPLIPFFAFLDSQGKLIVNSIRPADPDGKHGGGIGHPFEPWEIDWFLTMLREAAPRMIADELGTIEKPLRAQKH